jgi:phospho-N-acetylmuramoyl-pentapeptide-transferase
MNFFVDILNLTVEFYNSLFLRSLLGFCFSFVFSFSVLNAFIKFMQRKNFTQPISGYLEFHKNKHNTPTMGGVIIVGCTILTSLFLNKTSSKTVLICLIALFLFMIIGLFDDLKKIFKKHNIGISAKQKFILQTLASVICLLPIYIFNLFPSDMINRLDFPVVGWKINLGFVMFLFRILIIQSTTNAVNITDGLDGLMIVPLVFGLGTTGIMAYLKQDLLGIFEVKELLVFLAITIGSCSAFLWFNANPAKIFSGDTGSLSLGALLAVVCILIREELLLILIGFLFVLECTSVIIQYTYYKLTGKRFFRMAPVHHHFEKLGWSEVQVVIRFWMISFIFCVFSLIIFRFASL